MTEFFRKWMPPKQFGAFLLDLEDRVRAGAFQAHRVVRDNLPLSPQRSRKAVGSIRFPLMEQAFEEVCVLNGGKPLVNGVIPQTDLKVFQPFHRFEHQGQGIILGLAVMPEAGELPAKNMSRKAGVTLNYALQTSLFNDGAKIGDILVLFLVEKDRQTAGQLKEIAIGVIDHVYTHYLHYESLSSYMQGYADEPAPAPQGPNPVGVRLKAGVKPYVPPEVSEEEKKAVEEDDE